MQVIETEENLDSIYEHRLLARERSILNTISFLENHPLNQSSFLDIDEGASVLLYSKSSERDRVALEQFQMVSMVGKGTFAKVFLVYEPHSKKYYALKSMRKDVIISKKSVENINLERLIMLQVNHPFIVSMQYVF